MADPSQDLEGYVLDPTRSAGVLMVLRRRLTAFCCFHESWVAVMNFREGNDLRLMLRRRIVVTMSTSSSPTLF
jgi:hypothetical protein